MIRILAFILCMLPITAFGASYKMAGSGTCSALGGENYDCTASVMFDVAPEDFGGEVRLLQTDGIRVLREGVEVFYSGVLWSNTIGDPPGDFCTDACALATTEADGTLTNFWFSSLYFPSNSDGDFTRWGFHSGTAAAFTGSGTWTVTAVPLPAALPLFGAGLMVLALFGRFNRS